MAEALAHIALAVTTALAWLGLGSLVLRFVPDVEDPLLSLLNRLGVGALGFALITLAAGWARLLYPAAFILLFVATGAVGVVVAADRARRFARPRLEARWEIALVGLLVLYGVLSLLAVSAPISSPDALLYHAADPASFEQAQRIFEIPSNSSSYEPFSVEMLVLDGFLLWNSVQGAYAPLLLAFIALAGVVGFTSRLAGRAAGLVAGAVFFAQPFMLWETTSVFIESGLALAVVLAGWNLYRFMRFDERTALVLAGVFAGAAAGVKFLGLFVALAIAGVAAVLGWRRLSSRSALAFALPALLVAAPWYFKNVVLTGNPFYPHLFGGLNASAAAELREAMQSFGYGRSLPDFFLLPVRLLADAKPFDGGEFLSPLFLAFAPVTLLLCTDRRRIGAVWAGVILFVVAWFVTTQQARFLVPLMPVLAALAALGVLALASHGRLGRLLAIVGTTGALAVGLGASAVYAVQFAPVVVGTESKPHFLRQKVSNYDGVEWLNRNLGPNDRVATDIWALLYLRVPHTTFGTMGDLLPLTAGPVATRAFITKERVTHVAILDTDTARLRQVGYLDAHLVAKVPVRSVQSRTRGEFGPRHEMLVYALDSAR